MLAHGMRRPDLLDMTPAEIWYLFERAPEVGAHVRLERVIDSMAVSAPGQFKDGAKSLTDHIAVLQRALGASVSYTGKDEPLN